MTTPPESSGPAINSETISTPEPAGAATPVEVAKIARILEESDGVFSLEYENTRREKNTMSLDAVSYQRALREARSYLGIREDNRDDDGALWDIE